MTNSHDFRLEEDDRQLIAALGQLSGPPVPSNFMQAATARFQKRLQVRYWRHLSLAIGVTAVLSSAMVWLAIWNFSALTTSVGAGLGKAAVVVNAAVTVLGHIPQVGLSMTLVACVVTMGSLLAISKMAKKSVPVKL